MVYRWLAVAVAGVHAAYLVYLVVGGYLAWRLPKTFFLHVLALAWAVAIIAAPVACPLTTLQNALRVKGGQAELPGVFLDVYVRDTVYPAEYENAVLAMVGVAAAVSWLVLAVRLRRARRHP